jgi:hypothetical protein
MTMITGLDNYQTRMMSAEFSHEDVITEMEGKDESRKKLFTCCP